MFSECKEVLFPFVGFYFQLTNSPDIAPIDVGAVN